MLRIVNYNIHGGKDLFMRKRLDQMAETLSSLNADIIGLQEVHQNNRSGYQAAYLAELLKTDFAYGPALPIADGSYGNAILSKHPLVFSMVKPLPAKKEPRSLLQTTVKWENRYVDIWATHFSLDESSRKAQTEALQKEIAPHSEKPLVVLGDFNSRYTQFTPHLQDCGRVHNMQRLSTLVPFPKRVDYIFASSQWVVTEYQRIEVRWSDHYPILVTLQLAEP